VLGAFVIPHFCSFYILFYFLYFILLFSFHVSCFFPNKLCLVDLNKSQIAANFDSAAKGNAVEVGNGSR
jgi:hypothetical protein